VLVGVNNSIVLQMSDRDTTPPTTNTNMERQDNIDNSNGNNAVAPLRDGSAGQQPTGSVGAGQRPPTPMRNVLQTDPLCSKVLGKPGKHHVGTVRVFLQNCTLEDVIGLPCLPASSEHVCTNAIPLGYSLLGHITGWHGKLRPKAEGAPRTIRA
jgi:hypothetical protein